MKNHDKSLKIECFRIIFSYSNFSAKIFLRNY